MKKTQCEVRLDNQSPCTLTFDVKKNSVTFLKIRFNALPKTAVKVS